MSQIQAWVTENGLQVGDRLPPERELAARLGVSRATVSQAFVAHGGRRHRVRPARRRRGARRAHGPTKIIAVLRDHARQLPEIIEARDALETKLAALAAVRRTDADLAAIEDALAEMDRDIADGGRGVAGDEASTPR